MDLRNSKFLSTNEYFCKDALKGYTHFHILNGPSYLVQCFVLIIDIFGGPVYRI